MSDLLERYRPSSLETLAGTLLGPDPHVEPLPPGPPRALAGALGAAMLPALSRPPCGVSFSGGYDSSVVLAVAADVARREGLPLPIPLTQRFPGLPETEETGWQEMVVRHLRLSDWSKVTHGSELDIVGPEAAAVVRRFGLLTPANLHLHVPLLRLVAGGSLLTGVGGDELFGMPGDLRILVERPPVVRWPRIAYRVLARCGPVPLRARVFDEGRSTYPWLRPPARKEVTEQLICESWAGPVRYDRQVEEFWASRQTQSHLVVMGAVAADHDVAVRHPMLAPAFLRSAALAGGPFGPSHRRATIREHFGDLLPPAFLERRTKALFGGVVYHEHTREFVRTWDGSGLDSDQVDLAQLRAMWSAPDPDARASLLLQRAWAVSRELLPPGAR